MLSILAAVVEVIACAATELGAGIQATTQAGVAPVSPGEPSEPTVAEELVPYSHVRWYGQRRSLALRYAPRFYARHPNLMGFSRPLVLHRGILEYRDELARRVALSTLLTGSAGEVDYTSQGMVFSASQASQARMPVIDIAQVSAETLVEVESTRRLQLTFGGQAAYSTPLQETIYVATTGRLAGIVGERLQLTQRDTLGLSAIVSQVWIVDGARYWVAEAAGTWGRTLARDTTLELGFGVAAARMVGADQQIEYYPTGQASVSAVLARRSGSVLRGQMGAAASAGLDPILRQFVPVVTVSTGLYWERTVRWTGGFELSGATVLTETPLSEATPQTIASGRVFVRERLGRTVAVEYGARGQTRASNLRAEHLDPRDHEAWAYVQFLWALSTSRAGGAP